MIWMRLITSSNDGRATAASRWAANNDNHSMELMLTLINSCSCLTTNKPNEAF